MIVLLVIVRLVLAGVFALAAVAKLADRQGSTKAIIEFRLPHLLARILALLLPLAELVVAFLLIVPRSGMWGGVGALSLLVAFTIAIAANLIMGRTPDCHCFGQLHSAPVGWATVYRNSVFALCAGFIVWPTRTYLGSSVLQAASDLVQHHAVGGALAAMAGLVLVAENWLGYHLFRQHGRILTRIDNLEATLRDSGFIVVDGQAQPSLPIGSSAPSFELPLLSGEMASLESLCESRKPVLLVFSDPGCSPCKALLPDIARWEREYSNKLTVALIGRGRVEAGRTKTSHHGLRYVLLQRDREVAEEYFALRTPSAVLIDSNGRIGSSVAIGAQAISRLVTQILEQTTQELAASPSMAGRETRGTLLPLHHVPQFGQRPLPQISGLIDLDGNTVDLHDFIGHDTLLLFWNPNCGFCNGMLPDLQTWERSRTSREPQLVVISSGTIELNRAMRLQSSVLLDDTFSVGRALGVTGTPSAVLVDSDGNIVSAVAVGAASVLMMAATNLGSLEESTPSYNVAS